MWVAAIAYRVVRHRDVLTARSIRIVSGWLTNRKLSAAATKVNPTKDGRPRRVLEGRENLRGIHRYICSGRVLSQRDCARPSRASLRQGAAWLLCSCSQPQKTATKMGASGTAKNRLFYSPPAHQQ